MNNFSKLFAVALLVSSVSAFGMAAPPADNQNDGFFATVKGYASTAKDATVAKAQAAGDFAKSATFSEPVAWADANTKTEKARFVGNWAEYLGERALVLGAIVWGAKKAWDWKKSKAVKKADSFDDLDEDVETA